MAEVLCLGFTIEMLSLKELGTSLNQDKMIDDNLWKGPLLALNVGSIRQGGEAAMRARESVLEGFQEFPECLHFAPHQMARLLE